MAPHFSKDSPSHPLYRALRLHAALHQAMDDDQLIPHACWRGLVMVATGTHTPKSVKDYTGMMNSLLLIEREDEGIRLLPDATVARAALAAA